MQYGVVPTCFIKHLRGFILVLLVLWYVQKLSLSVVSDGVRTRTSTATGWHCIFTSGRDTVVTGL